MFLCLQLEQYKSVVFYGPFGSGKSYLTETLAHCIAVSILIKSVKCLKLLLQFKLNAAVTLQDKIMLTILEYIINDVKFFSFLFPTLAVFFALKFSFLYNSNL